MWITLLVMGFAVSLEPIRIGLTVLMLNRPKPILQLFVFLCAGFVMGVGGGLAILFILNAIPLAERKFTVHEVQIVIGAFALLVAIVLATNIKAPGFLRRLHAPAEAGGETGTAETDQSPPRTIEKVSARARLLMRSSSPWIAGVSGLGIALPSVDFLAALAVIHASGANTAVQTVALVMFNVVAFAMVEIPLFSYLIAPEKTRARMAALNTWIRSRSRREIAGLVAAAGILILAIGLNGHI